MHYNYVFYSNPKRSGKKEIAKKINEELKKIAEKHDETVKRTEKHRSNFFDQVDSMTADLYGGYLYMDHLEDGSYRFLWDFFTNHVRYSSCVKLMADDIDFYENPATVATKLIKQFSENIFKEGPKAIRNMSHNPEPEIEHDVVVDFHSDNGGFILFWALPEIAKEFEKFGKVDYNVGDFRNRHELTFDRRYSVERLVAYMNAYNKD